MCIQETHLSDNVNDQPSIEGYRWIGHCRPTRHVNAKMTHGGVGIFIKDTLYTTYNISILDRSFDGILVLLFKHKITEYCFAVYNCYLAPESSPYGRDNTAFYTHLLSLRYLHSYVDCSFLCGDHNARLGNRQDPVSNIDNIF